MNYPSGQFGFTPADELIAAIDRGLLTQEEARLVYWSQFPALAQNAATTPPPIGKAA